jgi:hypothetical protein
MSSREQPSDAQLARISAGASKDGKAGSISEVAPGADSPLWQLAGDVSREMFPPSNEELAILSLVHNPTPEILKRLEAAEPAVDPELLAATKEYEDDPIARLAAERAAVAPISDRELQAFAENF